MNFRGTNSKSQTPNKFQIFKFKISRLLGSLRVLPSTLTVLNFGFGICLGFGTSNFLHGSALPLIQRQWGNAPGDAGRENVEAESLAQQKSLDEWAIVQGLQP